MQHDAVTYADGRLDRLAERREDEAWLAAGLARDDTRVVVLAGRNHLLARGPRPVPCYLPWSRVQAALPDAQPVLLGEHAGVAYFAAANVDGAALAPPGVDAVALRDVVGELDRLDATVLALAGGLLHWHRTHGFCPACGAATRMERAGHARRCLADGCGRLHFPRTDPAVITLAIDGERCLLARRSVWAVNRRSTIAGFVEPGETLEQAVAREILEEVGIQVANVRYRGSQPWPFPASLMLGFHADANSTDIRVDGEEIAEADWYSRERIRDELADGSLTLPPADSISRALVEDWLQDGAHRR